VEYRKITFEVIDRVARIGFGKTSKKRLTTLDLETMEELDSALAEITERQQKDIAGLIFFSHKENVFLAGMDVAVIRDLKDVQEGVEGARDGQRIYNLIEDLLIPTVTCVDGVCLGGGFEMALACRTILVSDSPRTVLGAPEVSLGILPGFGGSYRLPRRIDLASALDLMLSGKLVRAEEAKKMGLVDEICVREDLLETALSKHIRDHKGEPPSEHPIKSAVIPDCDARKPIFSKARKSVLAKPQGQDEAPLRILDHLESSLDEPRTVYLEKEAQLLGELAVSEQSRDLQRLYFQRAAGEKHSEPTGDKA
jgi:3-hydroxyacyl-CoA dehydrogenase/enoyl-CoA hydratase/3-hydroxybutyryl-CoA epimerase